MKTTKSQLIKRQKYIALLRGINVSGKKKFLKAEQIQMLDDLGFVNPQVYIHTGNWIFESQHSVGVLQEDIMAAITEKFGWDVPVVVIAAREFEHIFSNCPFPKEKKADNYFTLFATKPSIEDSVQLEECVFPEEEFYLRESCVYFYSTISAGRVKMNTNFIEKKLKVAATSRNYKTMHKLVLLANS